ncbi:hypothetical protein D5018_15080 [Parashewanella curva]|uniref:Uncharacterized protein n=1 Tax=Parashewanella curva TaxID=2338552 RepID=A0A3L8PW78_9GAMM|nr:hypothetical protein [Parashewanella curva]RLV58873.1 hypothetical protein D5018_15080 [Parashewanella curva]
MTLSLMPKSLIALLLCYLAIVSAGLLTKTAVIFCLVLIVLVIAIIGKQKAALLMLRVFTGLQVLAISFLPYAASQANESIFKLLEFNLSISTTTEYTILGVWAVFCAFQVWVTINRTVAKWFENKNTFNVVG